MTENHASTRASSAPPVRGPEIDDATHRRAPVPPPPPAPGSTSRGVTVGGAAAQRGGSTAAPASFQTTQEQAAVPAPAPEAPAAPATSPQPASPVKEGAVKAAAAALAAARSAAKKVQSVMPDGAAKEQEPTGSASAPAAKPEQAEPRPEMHYSAGGVHGTAAPTAAPAAASPMVGAAAGTGPRRVRLSVSRVDPWSIMKLAFLLSVAIGFITVVATMVVWYVLNDMGTFATIQAFMSDTIGPQAVNLMQFVKFDRVVSLSVLIAIVNVVLMTALTTIMAILYNITAALVGGVHLTLTDE
ncbi:MULTISPECIES: DUF3566 domain-containing protein [unclassified Isoptericola]|uniref:DUF3566 domain-containing protein n=1 Tax=unclassified Isoptericola TaxID=2623355 RepID=UPI003655B266